MTNSATTVVASVPPNVFARRGLPPALPSNYVITPTVEHVELATKLAIRLNAIAAIGGQPGLGKTTAIAAAAANSDHRAVYVLMGDASSTRDVLATIWKAMTQTEPSGTMSQIKDAILAHLMRHPVMLMIDDAHYVSTSGLKVLTGLWNSMDTMHGQGVPIVLVGNDLNRRFRDVPELGSRAVANIEAQPLSNDQLPGILHQLEPRLTFTPSPELRQLNRVYFTGNLRAWTNFLKVVAALHPTVPNDTAYTKAQFGDALAAMGYRQ